MVTCHRMEKPALLTQIWPLKEKTLLKIMKLMEEISGLVLKGRKKILKTRKSSRKTYQMLKDTGRPHSTRC